MGWPEAILGCVTAVCVTYFLVKLTAMDSNCSTSSIDNEEPPMFEITTTESPNDKDSSIEYTTNDGSTYRVSTKYL